MAIAFVRQATGSGTTTPQAVTITAAAAGNMLVVYVASSRGTSAARTVSSISCTNCTFTKLTSGTNGFLGLEIWAAIPTGTSGTSVSITLSGTPSSGVAANVTEFSGISSKVLDSSSAAKTGTSTSPSITNFTTGGANDIILVAEAHETGTAPTVEPSGYNNAETVVTVSTTLCIDPDFLITSTAGSQSAAWTIGSSVWACVACALTAAVGALPSVNDSSTTTESVSGVLAWTTSVSDSSSITESIRLFFPPAPSESVTLTENVSVVKVAQNFGPIPLNTATNFVLNNASSGSLVLSVDVPVGDMLACAYVTLPSAGSSLFLIGISWGSSNLGGWTLVLDQTNGVGGLKTGIFVLQRTNSSLSSTVAIQMTDNCDAAFTAATWSGNNPSFATASVFFDDGGTNSGSSSSGTSASTGGLSTSNDKDLVLAMVGYRSTTAPSVQPSGYTSLPFVHNTSTLGVQGDYLALQAPGATSPTWTIPNADWATVLLAIVPQIHTLSVSDSSTVTESIDLLPSGHFVDSSSVAESTTLRIASTAFVVDSSSITESITLIDVSIISINDSTVTGESWASFPRYADFFSTSPVQQQVAQATSGSSITFAVNPMVAGNWAFIAFATLPDTGTSSRFLTSVDGDLLNVTGTSSGASDTSGQSLDVEVYQVTGSGTSITLFFDNPVSHVVVHFSEWSGGTAPDSGGVIGGSSVNVNNAPSATINTNTDTLLLNYLSFSNGTEPSPVPAGFTGMTFENSSTALGIKSAYQLAPPGSYDASWTLGASATWITFILSSNNGILTISVGEDSTVTESTTVSIAGVGTLTLTVSDTSTVTEQVSGALITAFTAVDNSTVTETLAETAIALVNPNDVSTGTESVNVTAVDLPAVNDSSTTTELITATTITVDSVTDASTGTENVAVFTIDSFQVSDASTITELVTVAAVMTISVNDSPTVTEAADAVVQTTTTVDDSSAGTENITATLQTAASVTEASTGTESITATVLTALSVTDASTGTENIAALSIDLVSVNDASSITESLNTTVITVDAVNDAAAITENTTVIAVALVSLNDDSTTTESITADVVTSASVIDSSTITESVLPLAIDILSVNDASTGTESVLAVTQTVLAITDASTTTEAIVAALTTTLSVSDASTGTESITVVADAGVSVVDASTETEALAQFVTDFVQVSDSSSITELVIALAQTSALIVDSPTITEVVQSTIATLDAVVDSSATTESIAASISTESAINDSSTGAESVSVMVVDAVSLSDQSSISEAVQTGVDLATSAVDASTATEATDAQIGTTLTVSDSASASELVASAAGTIITLNDTSSVIETAPVFGIDLVAVSDATTITESISLAIFDPTSGGIAVSDNLSVAELIAISLLTAASVSDSSTGVEFPAVRPETLATANDAISTAETVSVVAPVAVFAAELTGVTETIVAAGSSLVLAIVDAVSLTEFLQALQVDVISVSDSAPIAESLTTTPLLSVLTAVDVCPVFDACSPFTISYVRMADDSTSAETPVNIYPADALEVVFASDDVALAESADTIIRTAVLISEAIAAADLLSASQPAPNTLWDLATFRLLAPEPAAFYSAAELALARSNQHHMLTLVMPFRTGSVFIVPRRQFTYSLNNVPVIGLSKPADVSGPLAIKWLNPPGTDEGLENGVIVASGWTFPAAIGIDNGSYDSAVSEIILRAGVPGSTYTMFNVILLESGEERVCQIKVSVI